MSTLEERIIALENEVRSLKFFAAEKIAILRRFASCDMQCPPEGHYGDCAINVAASIQNAWHREHGDVVR